MQQTNSRPVVITGQFQWAAYAATLWVLFFAAVSFYWASGGQLGINTLGPALLATAKEPGFTFVGLWLAGTVNVLEGLIALALVQPWGKVFPQLALRTLAWIGGGFAFLYGLVSYVQHTLMMIGVLAIPVGLGPVAARWHLALWDPWWILGGILFIATAWLARRSVTMRLP